MYLSYYNLKRKPFQINTDPRFLWLGEKHKEALATLKYGIRDSKGFLLLTGEIGTGKTTLINALLNSLDENVIEATISDPALSRLEFFQYVAVSFGVTQQINSKVDFLMHFSRFLQEAADHGQRVLLIIDEAQRLTHELLEEIRLLSNIEKQQAKLLNIFFIGQSEFNQMLDDPLNKALRQRISVNYHIDTLSELEVADYIRHRLLVAGSRKVLFNPDAVHQVYLSSGGFPRLINILCDRALLTGYVEDAKQIKGKIVKECARELELPQRTGQEAGNRWWRGRKKSEMKPGETARTRGRLWRPVLVSVPALAMAAGLLFFNPAGWHEGRGMQHLRGIAADLRGHPTSSASPQAEAARVDADRATGPPAGSKPLPAQAAPEAEAGSLPPAAGKETEAGKAEDDTARGTGQKKMAAGGKKETNPPAVIEEILPDEQPMARGNGAEGAGRDASPEKEHPALAHASAPAEPTSPVPAGENAGIAEARNFIINFDIDSNELSPKSFKELDHLAQLMREHQELWAVVTGYTDTSGFYLYNKKISESRANMVKSYLVSRGISPKKIQTFGKGPENPIGSNETQKGRELNRRVEIELVKGG